LQLATNILTSIDAIHKYIGYIYIVEVEACSSCCCLLDIILGCHVAMEEEEAEAAMPIS